MLAIAFPGEAILHSSAASYIYVQSINNQTEKSNYLQNRCKTATPLTLPFAPPPLIPRRCTCFAFYVPKRSSFLVPHHHPVSQSVQSRVWAHWAIIATDQGTEKILLLGSGQNGQLSRICGQQEGAGRTIDQPMEHFIYHSEGQFYLLQLALWTALQFTPHSQKRVRIVAPKLHSDCRTATA